jgi:hypothetical protein
MFFVQGLKMGLFPIGEMMAKSLLMWFEKRQAWGSQP